MCCWAKLNTPWIIWAKSSEVGDVVEAERAGADAEVEDAGHGEDGAGEGVEEELVGGLAAVFATPDADDEEEGDEGDFEEGVEEEEVGGHEDAEHGDEEEIHAGVVFAGASVDGAHGGGDGEGVEGGGEDDEHEGELVNAEAEFEAEAGDAGALELELVTAGMPVVLPGHGEGGEECAGGDEEAPGFAADVRGEEDADDHADDGEDEHGDGEVDFWQEGGKEAGGHQDDEEDDGDAADFSVDDLSQGSFSLSEGRKNGDEGVW